MAADMVCAYYDRTADSRRLFEGTELAANVPVRTARGTLDWDCHLGRFDVIRLVMTDFFRVRKSIEDCLSTLTGRVLEELSEAYPLVKYDKDDLPYSMDRFYQATDTQFVIAIDEWDAVFRQRQDDQAGQTEFLDFLRDWLKDKPYVALAYMTGILPIKKCGQHSALNMFTEYSMMSPRQLAPYAGFTEDEVRGLCDRYGRDFVAIRDWYDGYEVIDVVPADPGHESLAAGRPPEARRYTLYSWSQRVRDPLWWHRVSAAPSDHAARPRP